MEQDRRTMKVREVTVPRMLMMARARRRGGWTARRSGQEVPGYTSSPSCHSEDGLRQRQDWAGQEAGEVTGGEQCAELRVTRWRLWEMAATRLNTEDTRDTSRLNS